MSRERASVKHLHLRLAAYKAATVDGNTYESAFRKPGYRANMLGTGAVGHQLAKSHCYTSWSEPNFARPAGEAHALINITHTGWIADNFESVIFTGVVFQLTSRHGQERYIAGYNNQDSGTYVFCLSSVYACHRIAAAASDDLARQAAEVAKEACAQSLAEQQIVEARQAIHETNKAALALISDIKGKQHSASVCAAIRGQLAEYLGQRRQQFRVIADRRSNFWSAVTE